MSTRVRVRANPGASRDAVLGRMADGCWKLSVTAVAEEGRANRALERLLARTLGVSAVRVVMGHGSRSKLVEVEGLDAAEVERRLERAVADK